MASLSACSFACSTASGKRSSRKILASGSTRSPGVTTVRLTVTKSDGARSCSTARAASSGCSDRTSSRARSSTRPSGRFSPPPSSGDAAGSAPMKHGVVATRAPSTTRLFSDTWWPPNRQPHGAGAAGLAEHPQVVQAGIAAALAVEPGDEALGVVEDVLQPHRGRDGDVPGCRQARRHQPHRRPLLGGALLVHRQAAVVGRRVEPAPALGVRGVVRRYGAGGHRALVRSQRVEPGARRLGHAVGDRTGRGDAVDDRTHRSTVAALAFTRNRNRQFPGRTTPALARSAGSGDPRRHRAVAVGVEQRSGGDDAVAAEPALTRV